MFYKLSSTYLEARRLQKPYSTKPKPQFRHPETCTPIDLAINKYYYKSFKIMLVHVGHMVCNCVQLSADEVAGNVLPAKMILKEKENDYHLTAYGQPLPTSPRPIVVVFVVRVRGPCAVVVRTAVPCGATVLREHFPMQAKTDAPFGLDRAILPPPWVARRHFNLGAHHPRVGIGIPRHGPDHGPMGMDAFGIAMNDGPIGQRFHFTAQGRHVMVHGSRYYDGGRRGFRQIEGRWCRQ